MTDITAPLNELRSAYRAYQNAKRDKKEEIHEKYRMQMEEEIRTAIQAEKFAFAKRLKDTKEFYDLRVTDIQDHVLRTRNWKVWEELRDFAGMEPEQISRENAREMKKRENAVFLWADDYSTLTVQKDVDGAPIKPFLYDMSTNAKRGTIWWPDADDNDADMAMRQGEKGFGYARMVSDEIQRAIDAGHVEG